MSLDRLIQSNAESQYPNVRPTLNLNFARTKTLDPRIDFTRASGGSYVGADGLIKYAGVNEARFDHDPETGECLGLLIEEQRTNFIKNGTSFDANWGNNDPTVGSGNAAQILTNTTETLSPDGTNNAAKIIQANNGWQRILQGVTLDNNNRHTFSIFVKQGNSDMCVVEVTGNFNAGGRIQWNFNTETFTEYSTDNWANLKYEKYPNGWYRLSGDFLATSISGTSGAVWFFPGNDYNGVPTTPASYTYVYGYQLEEGAFPTSYISRDASTATRNPDSVSMTGDNFSDWYNQSEGTIYCSYKNNTTDFTKRRNVYAIQGTPNGIEIRSPNIDFNRLRFVFNGNFNSNPTEFSATLNQRKTGFSYDQTQHNGCIDGTLVTHAEGHSNDNTKNILYIGNRTQGAEDYLNGTISKLTYYPRRLSNSQLQNLTK